MAQDFHAAFGLGTDDKHIATVDADGVALAAIQGLNEKVELGRQQAELWSRELQQQLEQKDTKIAQLESELGQLKRMMLDLSRKLDEGAQ
jgi:DNA-binding transcriptional MerR regulator